MRVLETDIADYPYPAKADLSYLDRDIADIKLPEPVRHVDSRGFCSEVFMAVGWSNPQGSGQ